MKIGELANAAKCSVETIRFYESTGLLPKAGRGANNYRLYHAEHEERLRFIRNCRALDMSHEEVRILLAEMDGAATDCGSVNAVLDEHIQHVAARIRELQRLKGQLTALRGQCQSRSKVGDCRIVKGLTALREIRKSPATHL
jgi:Cd(II)/Pb(II)-responsive transcriptional regulator